MKFTLHELIEQGPYPGDDFFRVKVTGDGETWCFNISPEQAQAIEAILAKDSSTDPVWNELGECRLCRSERWPNG